MTIDQITKHTRNAELLNALHACRPGHPLSNSYAFRNAFTLASQSRDIPMRAVRWLEAKANDEQAAA